MSGADRARGGRLDAWIVVVLARRRLWLALWGAVALALAPGVARLESDNSAEVFFLAGSPHVARYHELLARFGSDEGARLAVGGPGLWTPAGIDYLRTVERRARELPGVESVVGPARRGGGEEEPAALRERLLASPLDRALGLVDADGGLATLLVQTERLATPEASALYRALDLLAAGAPEGVSAFAVGNRSVELALDDAAREIDRVYFPLLVALTALLLALTFRDLSAVALPFAYVAAAELALLGAMGWAGVRLNLIVAILPPLVFAIALATALHLAIRCRALESEGLDAAAATRATYREKGRAILGTALTTAAGFFALVASPVGPVRTLGLWAGLGLLAALAAALTLLPALLATAAAHRGALPERGLEARLEQLGRRLASASSARPRVVVAAYAVAAAVALAGLPRLGVESNALTYLAADHSVRTGTATLERAGIGVATVELWLEVPAGAPGFEEGDALARLGDLSATLGRGAPALSALSVADLLDGIAAATPFARLPEASRRPGVLALARADPEGARAVRRLLTDDGRGARVTLFVETVGNEELAPLLARARSVAARRFPAARIETTGSFPLLLELQRHLVRTLFLSLALTLPALLVALALLLRDAGWVARALAASLWPVAAIFGGMGWLGASLDVATAMVASIVLGLVVDNAIHTLAPYRERRALVGAREAVVGKVESAAPAYVLTGAILVAGFGVCAFSAFAPTARFGALCAVAIALAVVADLTLLPALFGGGARGPAQEEGASGRRIG
ncbi:MAG: MMPL family transporter [Acidobacteria bacterium]|nr:MMPL family transporter [Acidobacteriota bacterium]